MGIRSGLRKTVLAAIAVAASAVAAAAATFNGTFSLGGSAFSDPGLVVNASPTTGSSSFSLNVGQSTTFNLFRIWTDETSVQYDDTIAQSIFASFTLTQPVASGTVSGVTDGNWGLLQYGTLNWGGPLMLSFGNGGLLSIALSNATFNWGLFGLTPGMHRGATVTATATYVAAPVPVPAAGALLLGGLGAMALMRRRRKA